MIAYRGNPILRAINLRRGQLKSGVTAISFPFLYRALLFKRTVTKLFEACTKFWQILSAFFINERKQY